MRMVTQARQKQNCIGPAYNSMYTEARGPGGMLPQENSVLNLML